MRLDEIDPNPACAIRSIPSGRDWTIDLFLVKFIAVFQVMAWFTGVACRRSSTPEFSIVPPLMSDIVEPAISGTNAREVVFEYQLKEYSIFLHPQRAYCR